MVVSPGLRAGYHSEARSLFKDPQGVGPKKRCDFSARRVNLRSYELDGEGLLLMRFVNYDSKPEKCPRSVREVSMIALALHKKRGIMRSSGV
jgi:hypothetical protein